MAAVMRSLMIVFMGARSLPHLVQEAPPAGAGEDIAVLGLVRPVDHERPPLHIIARQEPPVAAVLRVVAVITHYKVMFRRNGHRTVVLARIAAGTLPFRPGFDLLRHGRGLLQ